MRRYLGPFNRAVDMVSAALHRPLGVEGIDVSHWQGDVDWEAVAESGVRFAYIRASQGVDLVDRRVERNARLIGGTMPNGFYHFGSWYNADERRPMWTPSGRPSTSFAPASRLCSTPGPAANFRQCWTSNSAARLARVRAIAGPRSPATT
jgi:hypothetical protein